MLDNSVFAYTTGNLLFYGGCKSMAVQFSVVSHKNHNWKELDLRGMGWQIPKGR